MELQWQEVCRTAAPQRREQREIGEDAGCNSRTCEQERTRFECTEIIAGVTDLFTAWATTGCGSWYDNGSCVEEIEEEERRQRRRRSPIGDGPDGQDGPGDCGDDPDGSDSGECSL